MIGNDSRNGSSEKPAGRSYTLALSYSEETHQVSIGGDPMPLSLAQMLCNEGLRVLEEQRRIAAARMVRDTLEREAGDRNLAAKIVSGRA